ncbi:FkbM family methyltransferase [Brasilonema sp. UFV-L1]|uniref:FkbM family methyltransferase n=1 Tax=Brasilonema sp. UFV-L1 TaxID=2234130 RepID=UPI00145D4171|nr:FkbM family methyltransferase [Brasilonema sp. UFV-L1]NMG06333.1 FkbM family methyltransferase [Brasilonema sp. UFV-L1]
MSGIIQPIIFEPLKHIYKMLNQQEYFTYNLLKSKLGRLPRYNDCQVNVHGWNLLIPDSASFIHSYKEIFWQKIYNFKSANLEPKILDIGANIGLSILFFKSLYPEAEITAFEADPKIFNYLEKNVYGNGYKDVQLVNKAVWYENTTLNFVSDGADAGHIDAKIENKNTLKVKTVDIVQILTEKKFDFIKMDIEGAEEFVLPRCKDFLSDIKFIFVEYHSKVGTKQCLDQIISILSNAGFRLHIHNAMESISPFIDLKTYAGFDLQLNIFGWKET